MKRDVTIDLMKGIAIIMMMLAHLVFDTGMTKQIIHAVHMPLFLIVAGIFAKDISSIASFWQFTMKNAKRLLLPYAVTMLMLCVWGALLTYTKHDISYVIRHLLSMLTASADGWHTQWGLIYAGPIWFLIALFWVREIFYGIQRASMRIKYQDELILGICILLSVISVIVHPYMLSLPFCIMQSFTALGFYAVGWYIHRHPMPWWVYALCVVAWPFAMMYGYVGIDSCSVNLYPLSFIGACGGTYVIYLLCKAWGNVINKINIKHNTSNIVTPLTWCGVYSLPILCMHDFLIYSDLLNSIMLRIPYGGPLVWGGALAVVLAFIVLRIPIINKAFI